jgi:predicted AAA+ superfamily ATPase
LGKRYSRAACKGTSLCLKRCHSACSLRLDAKAEFITATWQLQEAKNTTTLAHYLDLLSSAGLLSGLQKFAMDGARRRASSPKWQVQNNALLSATSGVSFKQAMSDKKLWGRWVESCVGTHLLAHANSDFEIFYWNESNAEVDFILKWEEKYVALEVKLNQDKDKLFVTI